MDIILKLGLISSRGALLHESRKKMAAAKRRVAAKSLDEILVEADEFVNEMKKAGKKQKKGALSNFSRSYNGQTGK